MFSFQKSINVCSTPFRKSHFSVWSERAECSSEQQIPWNFTQDYLVLKPKGSKALEKNSICWTKEGNITNIAGGLVNSIGKKCNHALPNSNENYCNSFAHYLTSLEKQLYKCAIYIEHVLLMLCRTMFTKDSIRRNPSSAYSKTLL